MKIGPQIGSTPKLTTFWSCTIRSSDWLKCKSKHDYEYVTLHAHSSLLVCWLHRFLNIQMILEVSLNYKYKYSLWTHTSSYNNIKLMRSVLGYPPQWVDSTFKGLIFTLIRVQNIECIVSSMSILYVSFSNLVE